MSGTRLTRLIAGLFAIALVLAACSSDNGGGGTTGTTGGTSGGGATGGGGAGALTIEGFAFNPSTLQVSSGETTITITNNDGVTHTFTLDDGSVDQQVPAGASIDVTVNITQTTGFHCKIHPSMTGTLEVA